MISPHIPIPLTEQETQPLPILQVRQHTQQQQDLRFRRLKELSDRTGVRLLFVYLDDKKSHQQQLSREGMR